MRIRMRRLTATASAVGLGLMLLSGGPAGAAAHKPLSLAGAGSDTTYFMMNLILSLIHISEPTRPY